MLGMITNIVLVAIIIFLVVICSRYIIKEHKKGKCAGCGIDCHNPDNCSHYGEKLNL